jgi:hypothetical protein
VAELNESLSEKQRRFAKMIAEFICWIYEQGYEVSIGEVERPAWVARVYHDQGKGTLNSLHTKRLAADLHLFINGTYQTELASHKKLGEEWERRGGSWGGRFGDGNHYSLSHEGVR